MPRISQIINFVFGPLIIVTCLGFGGYESYKEREKRKEYLSRPIITERGTIRNESYDSFWGWGEYEIVIETEDGKKIVGNFGDTIGSSQKARTYDNLYDPGDGVEISGRNNEELAEEFGVESFLEDMEINPSESN